jgi:hypothetical protein
VSGSGVATYTKKIRRDRLAVGTERLTMAWC